MNTGRFNAFLSSFGVADLWNITWTITYLFKIRSVFCSEFTHRFSIITQCAIRCPEKISIFQSRCNRSTESLYWMPKMKSLMNTSFYLTNKEQYLYHNIFYGFLPSQKITEVMIPSTPSFLRRQESIFPNIWKHDKVKLGLRRSFYGSLILPVIRSAEAKL